MKNAVMIIIRDQDNYLLGKRSMAKAKAPGYWCPLSGHIEPGESEEAAVVREAFEEAGIKVLPLKKILSSLTDDQTVRLHWWTASILEGSPSPRNAENAEIRWFSKDELKNLTPVFQKDIDILLRLC